MFLLSFHLLTKFVPATHGVTVSVFFSMCVQNFAAQMAGGFDEKAGGAQMGVMQGPMVRKNSVHRHLYMYIKYLLKLCEIHFSVLNCNPFWKNFESIF